MGCLGGSGSTTWGRWSRVPTRGWCCTRPAREFAAAHGFCFAGCWPRDAARKGKVERPFRELKEALLEELVLDPPGSVGELNLRAARWLAAVVHPRSHRVTGEPPAERLDRERPLLAPLPRVRYDTARREPRRVGRVPLVELDGAHYSVPPELAGQLVEVRLPVQAATLEVRGGGQLLARHALVDPGQTAWDPAHRAALERLAWVAAGRPATCGRWPTRRRHAPSNWSSARATTRSPPPTWPPATTWTGGERP